MLKYHENHVIESGYVVIVITESGMAYHVFSVINIDSSTKLSLYLESFHPVFQGPSHTKDTLYKHIILWADPPPHIQVIS